MGFLMLKGQLSEQFLSDFNLVLTGLSADGCEKFPG